MLLRAIYARPTEHPEANYYAHPPDLFAEMSGDLKALKTYRLSSGEHDSIRTDPQSGKTYHRTKVH
jgi:primary-amine oxidase